MLPMGARIGTTSPRRKAMLLGLRPDLRLVDPRGSVDTRVGKWQEGQADALVLAAAGLDRLNRAQHVHQRFAIDELCPAPGQGALALETRCPHTPEATAVHTAIAALNCPDVAFATSAERAVLNSL